MSYWFWSRRSSIDFFSGFDAGLDLGSESLKPKPEAQENDGVRGELDKDEAGPTGGQQNTLNLAAVLNSGKSNHISVTDLTIYVLSLR